MDSSSQSYLIQLLYFKTSQNLSLVQTREANIENASLHTELVNIVGFLF